MPTISKDTPCLSITTIARDRLPVFRSEPLKALATAALDEARRSGGFTLFAYVTMPDHLHVLTDSTRKPSDTLRYVNGILSHRVIGYLKEHNFTSSLQKLRTAGKTQSYSLVEHHSNILLLTSQDAFMQRVNYIHQNPVRAGLVECAEDYRWSSARCWRRAMLEDEPLVFDSAKPPAPIKR